MERSMSYNHNIASDSEYGVMKVGSGLNSTNGVVTAVGVPATSYYGKFYSSTTQTNPVINTANLVTFPNTEISSEIINNTNSFTFNKAGVYTVTYQLQAEITTGGGGTIDVWAANNVQLVNSNSITTLEGGGSKTIINRTFLITSTAGETFRIFWSSPVANMQLTALGTQTGPSRPATNSANVLATLVQAL